MHGIFCNFSSRASAEKHAEMEPSTLINNTRLSQKQLQLHQQQRYFLENHNRYQQHNNVHVPQISHFPPPPDFPPPQQHMQQIHQTQQFQNSQQIQQQPIPAQRCRQSPKKYHQEPNNCREYGNQNNQNNQGVNPTVRKYIILLI